MATKTPGKISRSAKEWYIYFQFIIKRERERTWRLEKVANRVVVESYENSRKVSFSQRHCVNLMRLFFLKCFYSVTNFLVQNECMFLKLFSFTFMKIEQDYHLFQIHLNSADL